nr:signal peptidase II [uncultured Olsenella sp.]
MDATRPLSRRGMRSVAFLLAVCLVVVVDQAVKAAVRALYPVGEGETLIPGVLDLLHVENTGAAFSMARGMGPLLVVIAIAVLAGCVALVWREDIPLPLAVAIGCVAGGGVGNMIDRLFQGSVTDFLATRFVDFPVFNVADVFVTCGVAVSVVGYYLWDLKGERGPSAT